MGGAVVFVRSLGAGVVKVRVPQHLLGLLVADFIFLEVVLARALEAAAHAQQVNRNLLGNEQ